MEPLSQNSRRVIPAGVSKKEIFLGVLGALLVFAIVTYAIFNIGNHSSGTAITGKIIAKKFVPREETQLTIGVTGVQRQEKAGKYYLSVKADKTGEIYNVLLSQEDYNQVEIGDTYQIPTASLVE